MSCNNNSLSCRTCGLCCGCGLWLLPVAFCSYYYAHANNLSHHNVGTHGGEVSVWSQLRVPGLVCALCHGCKRDLLPRPWQPKLLAKAKEDPTRTPLKVRAVESYAWMDGKKRVKCVVRGWGGVVGGWVRWVGGLSRVRAGC